MEHFYIFCPPREQGSLKGLDCRVRAPLNLAHALLCGFLPEVCTASRLFCASRFLTAARSSCLGHPTWQLEIFLRLTWQTKSCRGKAAHQPHLVLGTRDCAWCPASTSFPGVSHFTLHVHNSDWLCSFLLITCSSKCTLKDLKDLKESAQERRWLGQYTTIVPTTQYTGISCSGKQSHIFQKDSVKWIYVIQPRQLQYFSHCSELQSTSTSLS